MVWEDALKDVLLVLAGSVPAVVIAIATGYIQGKRESGQRREVAYNSHVDDKVNRLNDIRLLRCEAGNEPQWFEDVRKKVIERSHVLSDELVCAVTDLSERIIAGDQSINWSDQSKGIRRLIDLDYRDAKKDYLGLRLERPRRANG